MKKFACVMSAVLLFAIMLTACTNEAQTVNHELDLKNNDESKQAAALYFIDVEMAKEQLKPAIWGSHGWQIWHPNKSDYIYASFGRHLLRYNISNNDIDRAITLQFESQNFIDQKLQLSSDGKHGLVADTYFIDFENKDVSLLSEADTMAKRDNIAFDGDNHNLDVLAYSIEHKAVENQFIASKDQETPGHEMTSLRGADLNGERSFVGIDAKIVGSLIPNGGDGLELGYYKFVLIDVEKDEIIQECPINIK